MRKQKEEVLVPPRMLRKLDGELVSSGVGQEQGSLFVRLMHSVGDGGYGRNPAQQHAPGFGRSFGFDGDGVIIPAEVDGHQAFRAEISYKDEDGLLYKGVMYGFMQNNWFYLVRYVAPNRFYFSRDEAKFEKIVKSLKLLV